MKKRGVVVDAWADPKTEEVPPFIVGPWPIGVDRNDSMRLAVDDPEAITSHRELCSKAGLFVLNHHARGLVDDEERVIVRSRLHLGSHRLERCGSTLSVEPVYESRDYDRARCAAPEPTGAQRFGPQPRQDLRDSSRRTASRLG